MQKKGISWKKIRKEENVYHIIIIIIIIIIVFFFVDVKEEGVVFFFSVLSKRREKIDNFEEQILNCVVIVVIIEDWILDLAIDFLDVVVVAIQLVLLVVGRTMYYYIDFLFLVSRKMTVTEVEAEYVNSLLLHPFEDRKNNRFLVDRILPRP